VQRRFAGAGSLLAAYTNSKLISDTDTLTSWLETGVGGIQNNDNLHGERSLSSQDVPQRLVVSYVLDLPFGKGKKFLSGVSDGAEKIVGGWGVEGVTIFSEGSRWSLRTDSLTAPHFLAGFPPQPCVRLPHVGVRRSYS